MQDIGKDNDDPMAKRQKSTDIAGQAIISQADGGVPKSDTELDITGDRFQGDLMLVVST